MMKKCIKRFTRYSNNLRIIKKMMLIYIIGGLIPLLMVSMILTGIMRRNLIEKATFVAYTNNERISQRLTEIIDTAKDVSDGLYLDKQLEQIITTKYTNTMAVINDLNSYTRIDDYLQVYEEISSIRIYVENETILDNSQLIKITDEVEQMSWFKDALIADGKMLLVYKYDEISGDNVLSLIRKVKNEKGEFLGVSAININNMYLNKIIQPEEYRTYVLLDNEYLLASNNNVEDETQSVVRDLVDLGGSDSVYTYDDKEYKIIQEDLPLISMPNDMNIYSLISLPELNHVANSSFLYSGVLIFISSLISVFMVYIFSKPLSDRINVFRKEMHQVAQGNFKIKPKTDGEDEIGQLSKDLAAMTVSIQKLIHEVYDVKLQKEKLTSKQKDVQFKMLASQINPHFLYNALETIRMKALINKQKEIAKIVKKLAMIMRRNLSVSNEEVYLTSELELIKNYLEIQQFRFGDKVHFSIDIQCNIEEYMILPLLLQPLVENAFVHGLEKKMNQGHIDIIIFGEGDNLLIKVVDDGLGIEQEKLNKIRYKLKINESNINGSIGLTNVNQRVKIYYGDQYDVYIDSIKDEGTEVILKLPKNSRGVLNV